MSNGTSSPYDVIRVIDHEKFGKLILDWALSATGPKNPMTLAEFTAEILKIPGVKDVEQVIHIPVDAPRLIQFVQGDESTMYISLSPKYMILRSMEAGLVDGEYGLPDFYEQVLDGVLVSFDEIFHRRVGDYSISGCR